MSLVLLSLAIRINYLAHLDAYPRFELIKNRLDDQVFLDSWAKAILSNAPLDLDSSPHEFAYWARRAPGVYPQAPLYPHFLALTYRVLGVRYDAVRAIQLLCGSAAVGLIYLTGARLFGATAGTFAGLGAALYGPFVFYEGTFLIDALTVFFSVVAVFLLCGLDTAQSTGSSGRARALGTGGVLGLSVLLRPSFLLCGVAAGAWVARRGRGVMLAAGFALALLPAIAVNSVRSGSLAFVSSNAPFNFLIGNVHDASGRSPATTPTYMAIKERSRSEPVSLWTAAVDDIRRHPIDFLRLQLRKLGYFFGGYEIPNNLNYYLGRRCNPALRWAPLELWMIVPLSVAGTVLALRHGRRVGLPLVFLFTYTLSVTAFFVVSRLRQPAVPSLLLFAGYAAAWGTRCMARRRLWQPALLVAASLTTSLLLRPAPDRTIRSIDYTMAAASYRSRGEQLERAGERGAAREAYLQALLFNPGDDDLAAHLGALSPATAPAAGPAAPELQHLWQTARTLTEDGRYSEAEEMLVAATQLAPEDATSYQYLANVAFLRGDHGQAARALEEGLRRDPTNPVMRRNLGVLRGHDAISR